MGMVKQDRNKDYIKFRIDAGLKEEFKIMAENKGQSMSSLMLVFIRESIEQEKKDQDYNLNGV
jgi:antitoxin component of RelBE/YafQ-DinJ toxin-antitoxin module